MNILRKIDNAIFYQITCKHKPKTLLLTQADMDSLITSFPPYCFAHAVKPTSDIVSYTTKGIELEVCTTTKTSRLISELDTGLWEITELEAKRLLEDFPDVK